ncbi:FKBP-type peptidyl-prolyl cis-trans isomerase [Salmonella enterica subsp. enterica serovar Glostrup]|nr:FKBP-type peptidyl-prolyl cis-trans isomerase [Salmonella enterica subsp. enterica serovar Glostrup]EIM6430246.1 FKBP-type peptidyl-prolyl cis-trans isomerase [Salmonella enterica]
MIKGKQKTNRLINSALIAVWLVLTMLSGALMLMLATTRVQAAEGEMPEVLRYAREYTRDRANQPAQQPERSLSRKLARSELIRRQQQARIQRLEKQLQMKLGTAGTGTAGDITRLTRELNVAGEKVRTLKQKLSHAEQENKTLQAGHDEAGRLATELATVRSNVTALEKEKTKLEKELQTLQAGHDEAGRLATELATVRSNVIALEKEKTKLEKELQTLQSGHDEAGRLATELATVRSNVIALEKEKTKLEKELQTLQAGHDEAGRLATELATVRSNVTALEKEKTKLEKELQTMKMRPSEVSLKTDAERQAYAAGVMYAKDVREARDGNRMLGISLNAAALHAGLNDALGEQPLRLDAKTLAAATASLEKAAAEAFRNVVDREAKLAEDWLKTFRKEKGVARDENGFWYRVTYEGDGERLTPEDTVDVVVEERRVDGTVVSDMDRAGSSLRQKVADFPPVFAAGLTRLKNHGQITLAVPPELAYGDRGYPPNVPPGAMMIYSIRVSDVIPAQKESAAGRQR